MREIDWEAKLNELDAQIKSGQMVRARGYLSQLSKMVPRAYAARVGQLMVRVNLALKAVAILNPYVRKGKQLRVEATVEERLALALALIRVGAGREAKKLLLSLPETVPQRHLYQAYISQIKWDYSGAIPFIEEYLRLSQDSEYDRAVAKINLLACLIDDGNLSNANELWGTLNEEARTKGWKLLQGHLVELSAQIAVAIQDWDAALKILAESKRPIDQIATVSDLLRAKWSALAEAKIAPTKESIHQLERVQAKAVSLSHWETIRDCDRLISELRHDQNLLARVYVGTPYQSFRRKLAPYFATWATRPEGYTLGSHSGRMLNLLSGQIEGEAQVLKPGQILHQALSLLFTDFYRPLSVSQIFAELFPEQHFDPDTSIPRVNMIIYRLRGWAEQQGFPLLLTMRNLAVTATISDSPAGQVYVPLKESAPTGQDLRIEGQLVLLRQTLGDADFNSMRAAELLGVSKSTANRILNDAVRIGILGKTGVGRATAYKWAA